MNRMKKYLLALLPALALWAGCSNMMEELGTTAASGPPDTTVYIYNADDLNAVRNDLAGYYVLMADIDLSGYAAGEGWVPIGDDTNRFTGTFDGNGHAISNLTINRGADYQGLFGCIGDGGTIINLGVFGSVTGNSNTGCLAGINYGTIENCYTSGVVHGTYHVGGIVGCNTPNGTLENCYATGDVHGTSNLGGLVGCNYGTISGCFTTGNVDGASNLGGLVGKNSGTIHGCYATGDVHGTNIYIGGLMGSNYGTISGCYATGDVHGNDCTGGLIGGVYGPVTNCYALGTVSGSNDYGGLTGYLSPFSGSISSCYYYQDPDNGCGTQVSSADMKNQSTYTGWDFTTVWAINGAINNGYPYLRNIPPGP